MQFYPFALILFLFPVSSNGWNINSLTSTVHGKIQCFRRSQLMTKVCVRGTLELDVLLEYRFWRVRSIMFNYPLKPEHARKCCKMCFLVVGNVFFFNFFCSDECLASFTREAHGNACVYRIRTIVSFRLLPYHEAVSSSTLRNTDTYVPDYTASQPHPRRPQC